MWSATSAIGAYAQKFGVTEMVQPIAAAPMATMNMACQDQSDAEGGESGHGLGGITGTPIISLTIISSVIILVSREHFDVGFVENDAEQAIV